MKAFPTEHPISGSLNLHSDGMDLRDYFAAKAMQAIACEMLGKDDDDNWKVEVKLLSKMSYSVANAMMEARK